MRKLLSGRFWLTIITGFVFIYCVETNQLTSEAITGIITLVFMAYFNKPRNKEV